MARKPVKGLTMIRTLLLAGLGALAVSAPARAADALPWLNAQRAALGLYPYLPAPDLQASAQYNADVRASRRQSGHNRAKTASWRGEGVGVRSGVDLEGRHFYSCLQASKKYRYAGAATSVRGGRTYYTLQLR